MVGAPTGGGKIVNLTVRQAMQRYLERKRIEGKQVNDLTSKTNVYILPQLGDLVVAELTDERLSLLARYHSSVVGADPTKRRSAAERAKPATEDERSHRRATANRALAVLKAGLNIRLRQKKAIGHINNRDAWDRRLKLLEDGRGGAQSLFLYWMKSSGCSMRQHPTFVRCCGRRSRPVADMAN